MDHIASHPESHGPQGRDRTPSIPREQFPFIQLRRPVRTAGAAKGLTIYWNIYAPQSAEVARYQAQQEAAQRNLGANVVQQQVATAQHYDTQPAAYYPDQTPNYYAQLTPNVQPVAPAAPVAEVAMGNGLTTDQATFDYIANTVNTATAPVEQVVNMGNGLETDLDTVDYLAGQVDEATATVDVPDPTGAIDIEAVRRRIEEMA